MNDSRRALSEIADIRAQLAASTRFRGYAPEAVALIGLASLAVMLTQIVWPSRFAADNEQQVLILGALLVASGLTVVVEAVARSRQEHGEMATAMLRAAIRVQFPVIILGLMVGVVVFNRAPEVVWILPGIWHSLIGVVATASYSIMPRSIIWPALWFVATGSAVMWLAGTSGELTPPMTCGPLVVGYLAIAWALHRERNTNER